MRKIILPPLVFLTALIAMILLHLYQPGKVWQSGPLGYIGILLIALGVYIPAWAVRVFKQAETNLMPYRDPDAMVTEGPFGFSRNPMYLGLLCVLIGVAVILGTVNSLIVLPAFFAVINWYHIPFEEARMAAHFGENYTAYKAKVRRWI